MRTPNPIFDWLKILVSRIRTPVTMRRLDQDFGEELEAHLALARLLANPLCPILKSPTMGVVIGGGGMLYGTTNGE